MWPTAESHDGNFVRDQVESVRALGVEVDVEVIRRGRGSKDYLLAIPRVRRRIQAAQRVGRPYDLVHVHYGLTALATRFVGGVPRVVSFYGSDINSPIERRLSRLGMGSGVARTVYVSARLAGAVGDEAAEVIPNGIDFNAFSPGDRPGERRRMGIGDDQRIVLFGGDPDDAVKGYDIFSDVLSELQARGLPVSELLLSAPNQTTEQVVAKFDVADCLLFCSRYGTEGSPTVVKEATVMGLPVVTVDVGDVSEVLAQVTPSAIVPFPQPWGTAAARAELVATLADETAKVLGEEARSNGRDRNGWLDLRLITRRVVSVYQDVVAG
jgi:teichuronic acid biosynthesis glycosyltransferase TuaC